MNPEALRAQVTGWLDDALGRWLLPREYRPRLVGLKAYVQAMTADELTKLGQYLPQSSFTKGDEMSTTVQAVECLELPAAAGATAGGQPRMALGGVLGSILAALFSSGPGFVAVLEWLGTHYALVTKAVQDVLAGADLQTVIADLLALLKGGK